MAAPRRRKIQASQPATTAASSASPMQGGLRAEGQTSAPPMTVHAPGSSVREQDMFMLKVSQLVMMGIGFLAIWGGILIALVQVTQLYNYQCLLVKQFPYL